MGGSLLYRTHPLEQYVMGNSILQVIHGNSLWFVVEETQWRLELVTPRRAVRAELPEGVPVPWLSTSILKSFWDGMAIGCGYC